MQFAKKDFYNCCSVMGCGATSSKFAIRKSATGSRYWAFAAVCLEHSKHFTGPRKRSELAELEFAIKNQDIEPYENLYLFSRSCTFCGNSNLKEKHIIDNAILYLWKECSCDTTAKSKMKTTNTPTEAKMTKPLNSMDNFTKMFKKTGTEAAKRVAAGQAVKLLRAAIVKGLQAQGSEVAAQASAFLETSYGEALLGAVAGIAMQQFKLPGVTSEVGETVGEELLTQAMANAGNKFIADFSGPMLEAMASLAAPLEQVRVSLENEKAEKELPAAAAPEVSYSSESEEVEVDAFDFAKTKQALRESKQVM